MCQSRIYSLDPVIDRRARVLVLGSIPGRESLLKQEYYANPRNHFWKIIFKIFMEPEREAYHERIQFLKERRIALWDVIGSCHREGSLDANIKDATPNDLLGLLKSYPSIRLIAFNGGKAYTTFKKSFGQLIEGVQLVKLPSTSPVPGKNVKPFDEKVKKWQMIKAVL